jgi:hypothetical protein
MSSESFAEVEDCLTKALESLEAQAKKEMIYETPLGMMKESKPTVSKAALLAADCADIIKKIAADLNLKTRSEESNRIPIVVISNYEIVTRIRQSGEDWLIGVTTRVYLPDKSLKETKLDVKIEDLEQTIKTLIGEIVIFMKEPVKFISETAGIPEKPVVKGEATGKELSEVLYIYEKFAYEVPSYFDQAVNAIVEEEQFQKEHGHETSKIEEQVMKAIYETIDTPEYFYKKSKEDTRIMPLLRCDATVQFLKMLPKLLKFLEPPNFIWGEAGFEGKHWDALGRLSGVVALQFFFNNRDRALFQEFQGAIHPQFVCISNPQFIEELAKRQDVYPPEMAKKKKRTDSDLLTMSVKIGGSRPDVISLTTKDFTLNLTKKYSTRINPPDKEMATVQSYRRCVLAFEEMETMDDRAYFMTTLGWVKKMVKSMNTKQDVVIGMRYAGGTLEVKFGYNLENSFGDYEMDGSGDMESFFIFDIDALKKLTDAVPLREDSIATFSNKSGDSDLMVLELEDSDPDKSTLTCIFTNLTQFAESKPEPEEEPEEKKEEKIEGEGESAKGTLQEQIARLPEAWKEAWEEQFSSIYGDDRNTWPPIPDLPDDWKDFVDSTLEIDENIKNIMEMMKKGEL